MKTFKITRNELNSASVRAKEHAEYPLFFEVDDNLLEDFAELLFKALEEVDYDNN